MPEFQIPSSGGGIQELASELRRTFGGEKGLAKKIKEVFDDENATPTVKNQVTSFVIKVMSEASEAKGRVDYQAMTTADLKAYALRLIADHEGSLPQQWGADGKA